MYAQNFTITPAAIPACSPSTVTCTPNSPIPVVFSWQVNAQPTVAAGVFPYTFLTVLTTGTYNITMYYAGGSAVQSITIFPSPSVSFVASDLDVCQGQTVNFDATPVGGTPVYSYNWSTNSGSGVVLTAQNVSDVFNINSTINVSLILTDANGCTASQTQLLTVNPIPNATFTSTTAAACTPPQNITFTSAQLPAGTSHYWDFGDNNSITTLTDPTTHTYLSVGSFTVTHIVTTPAGCSDTATGSTSFGLLPPIVNNLTSNVNVNVCEGANLDLTWTPYPNTNTTINWVADPPAAPVIPVSPASSNSSTPTFVYSTAGSYTITATMTDVAGCFSNQMINVTVNPAPVFDFYADDTFKCTSPLNTVFTIISASPLGIAWTPAMTQLTNITYQASFTAPPAYHTVTATAFDGFCSSTVTKTNYIHIQNAVADFISDKGIPAQLCQGQSVTFDGTVSTGALPFTYAWTFTGGSPASSTAATPLVSYATQGQYPVSLTVTDANGCTNTKNLALAVKVGAHISPLSYYLNSGSTLCASQVVSFLNGTSPQPPGATAQWVVYNASTAFYGAGWASANVAVNGFGTFQTKLITNNNGCKDSLSDPTVTITVLGPVALFGVTSISACKLPEDICFMDTANTGVGIKSWYVNNVLIGTGNPPCYTISTPGTYVFKLIIQGAQCTDSLKINVNATQVSADFSADVTDICAGGLVNFTPAINGLSYYWDYGDPNNNSTQIPPYYHIYADPGNYEVILYASGSGCQDTSAITTIQVGGANLTTSASPQQGCAPLTTQFNAGIVNSFPAGTPVSTWSWDFGDNSSSNLQNPTHTYTVAGSYQVVLYATDAYGCTTHDSLPALIDVSLPIAAFSANFPINCANNPLTFTSTSTGFGTITYNWYFDTGGTPTINNQSTITHQYTANGTYTPTLIIEDILGCKDTLTLTNYINISPLDVSFNITGTTIDCPPLTSTFTATVNSSHVVSNNNFVWYYSGFTGYEGVGIGNPSQHPYLVPGLYSPTLLVTSDAGCLDTAILVNAIDVQGPTATITFSPHQACPGETINLNAVGTAGVISYTWVLPGSIPNNPTGANVSLTFPPAFGGTYIQPYVLVTDGTCAVTMPAYDSVYIFRQPISNFVADDTVACLPSTLNFTATSIQGDGVMTAYSWNFGETAGINATGATASHAYNTAIGFYTPYLITKDANGCSDSLAKFEYIKIIENNQPLPVALKTVSVTGDAEITLTFSAFNNVLGDFGQYVIERQANGGGFSLVGTVTTLNTPVFIDNTVNTLTNTYCYRVKVENGCQNQSVPSDVDCSINLVASPQAGAVDLSWNNYVGWAQILAYKIYKVSDYNTANATLLATVSGTTTNFKDSISVRCSDLASYRVKAIQQGTNLEAWSDSATSHADLAGLSTLTHIKTATVESSAVKIQWDLPTNVSFLQGMRLDKNVGGSFTPLQTFLTTDLQEYIDNNVTVNTQSYTYHVVALDSCGNETQAGRVGQTMVLSVLPAGSRLMLSWTPYSEWKNGVLRYEVELMDINTQTWTNIGSTSALKTTFSDEEIRFAQPENCYRIVAVERNGAQARSMSNESCGRLEPIVYVPTGFTPNGDGVNDFFTIKSIFISTFKIRIYDRWSKLIYEGTEAAPGWDGKINGTAAPEGTYVYHIEIVGNAGEKKQKNGSVTVVR